jgi:hypothetical protein
MDVTVEDVKSSVIAAVAELFPGVTIYAQEIGQAPVEPYFVVVVVRMGQTKQLGSRYMRSHSFDIQYFSSTNEDVEDVAERLYEGLENIAYGGNQFRCIHMAHELASQVLHFYFDIQFRVLRDQPASVKMQQLNQEGELS